MADMTSDLTEISAAMERHNVLYSACVPARCDTVEAQSRYLISYFESLGEPVRLQVMTAILLAVRVTAAKHSGSDYHLTYINPTHCS